MRWKMTIAALLASACVVTAARAQQDYRPDTQALRHYIEGVRLMDLGRLEAAEQELEEAVRIDPDYVDALSTLALVYLKRGKTVHYRAMLERAVAVKSRQSPELQQARPLMAPPELAPEPPPAPPRGAEPSRRAELERQELPAPKPQKRPEPKDVFIVASRDKRDPLGNLRIEGQVKNNTSRTVRRVEVALAAYSASGRPIDPPLTYRGPWELLPGQEAPFSLDVVDREEPVERFDLKPSWELAQ